MTPQRYSEDWIGKKFGKLTVLGKHSIDNRRKTRIKCLCDCNKICVVEISCLNSGHTQSCGCLHHEWVMDYNTTHGMTNNRFYNTWKNIKNRCLNEDDVQYHSYGERGIQIHPEWIDTPNNFIDYISQLENSNKSNYSLDRINNNGNYEPGNLRWATSSTQGRNRRTTKLDINKVKKIKDLISSGEMLDKDIAELFNVSKTSINNIRHKKTWKDV